MATHRSFAGGVAIAAALLSTPLAAQADLGEFTWRGREGSGRLVWNLDAVDSDPAAQSASFADGLVSFDFTASHFGPPGGGIHVRGTGGSYTSSWTHRDPAECDGSGLPCNTALLQFDLGSPIAGDPARYTLTFSTLFALDDGRLPIPLPGRADDYRWLAGGLTNDLDDRFYLVFDTRSNGETNVIAAPVPEPEAWALLSLGLCLVGWMRRRQAGGRDRAVTP